MEFAKCSDCNKTVEVVGRTKCIVCTFSNNKFYTKPAAISGYCDTCFKQAIFNKRATFGYKGTNTMIACIDHKTNDMINLNRKKRTDREFTISNNLIKRLK